MNSQMGRTNLFSQILGRAGLFAVFLIIPVSFAGAGPSDPSAYDKIEGGLVDIQDKAFVEGSVKKGGIQPDYYIDLEAEPLKGILAEAAEIGKSKLDFWQKIDQVLNLVRNDVFKYSDYHNPYYRRLLKSHRDKKTDVNLSEYAICGAGVCREHALVLHFALKAAGVENKHAYAKIYRASQYHDYQITEDHAFTVVRKGNVDWVIDAYYWGFNGFRLKDLMSRRGITERSPIAPVADPGPGTRKILEINNFPAIYNPKGPGTVFCGSIFI